MDGIKSIYTWEGYLHIRLGRVMSMEPEFIFLVRTHSSSRTSQVLYHYFPRPPYSQTLESFHAPIRQHCLHHPWRQTSHPSCEISSSRHSACFGISVIGTGSVPHPKHVICRIMPAVSSSTKSHNVLHQIAAFLLFLIIYISIITS